MKEKLRRHAILEGKDQEVNAELEPASCCFAVTLQATTFLLHHGDCKCMYTASYRSIRVRIHGATLCLLARCIHNANGAGGSLPSHCSALHFFKNSSGISDFPDVHCLESILSHLQDKYSLDYHTDYVSYVPGLCNPGHKVHTTKTRIHPGHTQGDPNNLKLHQVRRK